MTFEATDTVPSEDVPATPVGVATTAGLAITETLPNLDVALTPSGVAILTGTF